MNKRKLPKSTFEMLLYLLVLLLAEIQARPSVGKPATQPSGCFYDGNWYPPGTEISHGSDGKGWCYGMYCDEDGGMVPWDDWNCGLTVQTTPPTTSPQPTHHGCLHNGEWYPPGSDISKGSDGMGWCYGTFCTADGRVAAWDDWDCDPATTKPLSPTTTPASTTTPVPVPTTTPAPTTAPESFPTTTPASTTNSVLNPTTVPTSLGCFQNGAWYEPGSEISRELDEQGWCHGISCDSNGKIVAWDDWNCAMQLGSTVTKPQQEGCYYENQWHPYGSMFEGSDSRGCKYGAICDKEGQVTHWDEIGCNPAD